MTIKGSEIRKAVIPAAGRGTRLQPLTAVVPKELLPLGAKPAAEFIVEELHAAGVNDIIFVVSVHKTAIKEYFGDTACGGDVRISYVFQHAQRGLADAILQAEEAVAGEDFVVALGDTVITSSDSRIPLSRLVEVYQANQAFAGIIVERVSMADVHKYGIVEPAGEAEGAFEISGLVEKPKPELAPGGCAIAGRYVFSSQIFDWIRRTNPGVNGEYQITDSIRLGMADGARVWCIPLEHGERRYDIGNVATYCEAFAAMCMLHSETSAAVEKALRGYTK